MLGASTLSAMCHQANYLGEHREALHLARAAQQGLKGHTPELLEAQFAAMEARAAAAPLRRPKRYRPPPAFRSPCLTSVVVQLVLKNHA
ncbi:hypothetical protein GCM10009780_26270 [Actinomadura alba]